MTRDLPRLALGSVLADRFQIEGRVGAGGMGEVYRAHDRLTGQPIAVKLVRGGDVASAQQFAREATLLAGLSHPAIVRYVTHGKTPAGAHYLVMEWVDGETVAERLDARGLTLSEAVTLGIRVADALGEAHRNGVIHRDVKPRNLLLPRGEVEKVKIIDFGVAKRPNPHVRARAGIAVGTPGYMSPEQVRGAPDVDARADVFALGCVLYQCLAGQPAFAGDDEVSVQTKILLDPPIPLRKHFAGIPLVLERFVGRMLAKNREERPSDGSSVATELAAIAATVLARSADTLPEPTPMPSVVDSGTVQTVIRRPQSLRPPSSRSSRGTSPTHPDGTPLGLTVAERRMLCLAIVRVDRSDGIDEEAERRFRDVTERHGASAESWPDGSRVLTITGADAATDLAARAARAALALQALVPEARIALVTGRGVFGSGQLPRELVDEAIRVLGTSAEGAIRIDDPTAGLLHVGFEIGGDATGLWLRGEREIEQPPLTLLGRPSPFVGRDRELATILGVLEQCVSEPVARAVLLTGPMGSGKSRLGFEFLDRVRRGGERMEVILGRGDPVRAGSPFSILAPALRRAAGVLESEPPDLRYRKLRARIGRHVDGVALPRVADFLGELAGVPSPGGASEALRAARADPVLMSHSMLAAWLDWISAECSAAPQLLVLEELQWGDGATVQYVDAALRTLRERPFFVLAIARPEVHTQFPGLFVERDVQEVRLARLTRRASEQLVRASLGDDVDAGTLRAVVERADGNPFFLEELVRAIASGAASLPETVLGMIQSRLDRLGTASKRVLRAASVFGETFWEGGVEALLGGVERFLSVEEWLDELILREIVVRRDTTAYSGEKEFVFRHPLLREAAYETLTSEDRALGHRLAAEWLENAGEREPRVLAEHFERGGDPARAVAHWRHAAEQALEANDLAGAAEIAGRALSLGASDETRNALLLVAADARRWRGEYEEAERAALDAVASTTPGSEQWLRGYEGLVLGASRRGHVDDVVRWVRRVMGVSPQPEARAAWIRFLAQAAVVLGFAGRPEEVEQLYADLEAASRGELDPATAARVEETFAIRAMYDGDFATHLARIERTVELLRRAGDVRRTYGALANLGFSRIRIGDPERAAEILTSVAEDATRMGLESIAAAALTNLAEALMTMGRLEEARSIASRALDRLAGGDPRMKGGARVRLAMLAHLEGRFEEAESESRAAAELFLVSPPLRPWALATLVRALVAQGRIDEAHEVAREAIGLVESLGNIEMGESLARLAWAEVLDATGDVNAARDAIREAWARVRAIADRLEDAEARERFLRRVPENAWTMELAAKYGVG